MAPPDDKQKKMDDLGKRIEDARCKNKDNNINEVMDAPEEASPEELRSARAGSEFLANVFAGAFIGYGLDWYFLTTPWAMIVFILLGFISGVYRANEAIKNNSDKNDKS